MQARLRGACSSAPHGAAEVPTTLHSRLRRGGESREPAVLDRLDYGLKGEMFTVHVTGTNTDTHV